ncbi:MAG: hypothetical protein AB7V08_06620 [Elusimicrobiales bacterium]
MKNKEGGAFVPPLFLVLVNLCLGARDGRAAHALFPAGKTRLDFDIINKARAVEVKKIRARKA